MSPCTSARAAGAAFAFCSAAGVLAGLVRAGFARLAGLQIAMAYAGVAFLYLAVIFTRARF